MTSIIKGVLSQARKQGDPLANIIKDYSIVSHSNKVDRRVTVFLGNEDDWEAQMKVVDIDITKTPFENAKYYYDIRASMIDKEKKTLEATNAVLKQAKDAAEKKIKKKEEQIKAVRINRKAQWYEKFYWFVSSENYLVISAKDAHQNETIIKKYLAKDDIVFHTQVQGSAFSLVKNPKGGPVPHQTLQEAAQATLCHSRCWDQKVVSEVFWVNAEQVSKTAPTGMFVGLGSFMIYGRKNFITPARLEMGFGLFFKVDEESAKNHAGERKRRDEGNEMMEDDPDRLIRTASDIVVTPKDFKKPKVDDKKPQEANQTSAENAEEGGAESSDEGSEGGDIDEGVSMAPTSKIGGGSVVERSITIGKDTECTYIKNTISSGKTSKSMQDHKKKQRQDKKAGIVSKKEEKAPAKAPEPVNKQLSKSKKNRMKKMAEKYGEMDEEERAIQMEMLGAKSMKLTVEQQKMLNKKMKEGRIEAVEEEAPEAAEQEESEESEDAKAKAKGGKGKDKDKKDGKGDNKKAGNKDKGSSKPSGKQEKGGKGGKAPQSSGKGSEGSSKKQEPQTKGEKGKPIAKETEKKTESPEKPADLKPVEQPVLEEEESPKVQIKPEEMIEEKTPKEEDGEEEMQDLEDQGDDNDGPDDEEMEAKKETMSVLNTVLDEEAEKNLNDVLDFKEYTGIPKNNGKQ